MPLWESECSVFCAEETVTRSNSEPIELIPHPYTLIF
jgi:hypothetical protein